MESKKDLSIKTVPVEIRVLTVDGKRMTKSVFLQIQEYVRGDGYLFEIKDDSLKMVASSLGWVNLPDADWLLFNKGGMLCKIRKRHIDFDCDKFPGNDGVKMSTIKTEIKKINIGIPQENDNRMYGYYKTFECFKAQYN
jgi:hypothetical protein